MSDSVPPIAELTLLEGGRIAAARWSTGALAAALAAVIALQRVSIDSTSGPLGWAAFAGVSVACLALTLAVLRLSDHHVAAAALLVAVSPTVFASMAAGERHGAVAVVLACIVALSTASSVWPRSGLVPWPGLLAMVLLATVLLASWWRAGLSRGAAPSPSWNEILESTGATVRSGLGVVGPDEIPVPTATFLGWWCAVGVVVGVVVLGGRARVAAVVPAAVGAFVVVAWLITWQRGPVDAAGGMWLVSAAIAYAGASASSSGPEGVRTARLLTGAAGLIWAASFVRLHRSVDASPALLVAVAVLAAVVVGLLWPGAGTRRRSQARS